MTSEANGEWVRQGTPHDENVDWNEEQSEYGTAVSPTEWDDYSSEQSVPVAPPRVQAAGGVTTAGSPAEPEATTIHSDDPAEDGSVDEPCAPVIEPEVTEIDVQQVFVEQDSQPTFAADDTDPVFEADLEESASDGVGEADTASEAMEQPQDSAVQPSEDDGSEAETDSVYPDEAGGASDVCAGEGSDVLVEEPAEAVDVDDAQATEVVLGATVTEPTIAPEDLYRSAAPEETAVIAQQEYPTPDAGVEEERLQAQLAAERQAREQRLGAVRTSSENATRENAGPARVTTDNFFPSFGLLVLRVVAAAILGVASYQILGSGVDATAETLGRTLVPEPRLVAWILGFTLGVMALLLIIGLMQRVVGFLLFVLAVGSLVFIRWGNFSVFSTGVEGFIGDQDLLLAAVGLLLITIGGGSWGVDGTFRRARAAAKAEKQG